MKNQTIFILSSIVVIIILGFVIWWWSSNKEGENRNQINLAETYLNRPYQFNAIFNSDDMDVDIEGTYTIENNTLTYEIEEGQKKVYKNLYKDMYQLLPNITSVENNSKVEVSSSQLKKILLFVQLPYTTGDYECNYEIEDGQIYTISCKQGTNSFTIDFDFE